MEEVEIVEPAVSLSSREELVKLLLGTAAAFMAKRLVEDAYEAMIKKRHSHIS